MGGQSIEQTVVPTGKNAAGPLCDEDERIEKGGVNRLVKDPCGCSGGSRFESTTVVRGKCSLEWGKTLLVDVSVWMSVLSEVGIGSDAPKEISTRDHMNGRGRQTCICEGKRREFGLGCGYLRPLLIVVQ